MPEGHYDAFAQIRPITLISKPFVFLRIDQGKGIKVTQEELRDSFLLFQKTPGKCIVEIRAVKVPVKAAPALMALRAA